MHQLDIKVLNKCTYLYLHLLVLFLVMDHQYVVINHLKLKAFRASVVGIPALYSDVPVFKYHEVSHSFCL